MCQMFQLFQTYVASVLSRCCICCSGQTYMLQEYVVNVSSVSDVCCSKCFMLQVFHEHEWEVGVAEVVPSNAAVPARTGSEAGVVSSMRMHNSRSMHTAAAGGAGSACATAQRAARTTMCGWRGRQELHALFFDLPVITWSNSSPTSLF